MQCSFLPIPILCLYRHFSETYIVEPLYSGHPWDKYKCPVYRAILISEVNLYYKAQFGTFVSVLNTEVSSVLNRGVSLY